jgi:hypothetical protein
MYTVWATAKCGIPLILEKSYCLPRFNSPVGNRMSLGSISVNTAALGRTNPR